MHYIRVIKIWFGYKNSIIISNCKLFILEKWFPENNTFFRFSLQYKGGTNVYVVLRGGLENIYNCLQGGGGCQGFVYVDKNLINFTNVCSIVNVTKMSIFIRIVCILTIPIFCECKLTNNCNFMIVDGTTIIIFISDMFLPIELNNINCWI